MKRMFGLDAATAELAAKRQRTARRREGRVVFMGMVSWLSGANEAGAGILSRFFGQASVFFKAAGAAESRDLAENPRGEGSFPASEPIPKCYNYII